MLSDQGNMGEGQTQTCVNHNFPELNPYCIIESLRQFFSTFFDLRHPSLVFNNLAAPLTALFTIF